jgi:hypothetical protein
VGIPSHLALVLFFFLQAKLWPCLWPERDTHVRGRSFLKDGWRERSADKKLKDTMKRIIQNAKAALETTGRLP